MFAVIGLGNPGEKYAQTRHNVGQMVLGSFLSTHHFPPFKKDKTISADSTDAQVFDSHVEVVFPSTYMNLSGSIAKLLIAKHGLSPQHIIVIHDDVHLPLGSVRVSFGKGEGGHNGVASIIQALNTKDFVRIRVGVAQKSFFGGTKKHTGKALSEFVLRDFTSREQKQLPLIEEKVARTLELIITRGVEHAMQECNAE